MADNEDRIPQHLRDRPDLKFLNRHVREQLCAKSTQMWKDLGVELLGTGSNDALEVIKNNTTDLRDRCSAMFQLWLDRQPTASWRQLIQALKKLRLDHLAHQIELKLTIPVLESSFGMVFSEPQRDPILTNEQLMAEFSRLLMRICRILSQSPNQKDNLKACKQYCRLLKGSDSSGVSLFSAEKKSEIDVCRNFEQLFEIVNQHLSWDEHSILSEIIDECDSVEAEQEFDQYKKKMAVSKALEIISSTESDPPQGFEKFYVIISKPYKKLTIDKYEEIKTFIFNNLKVHRYVTTGYIRVLFDSLHLEWHVTLRAIPDMIKMAYEQRAVFTENSYVFMKVGKEIIVDTHTQQTSVKQSGREQSAAGDIQIHVKTMIRSKETLNVNDSYTVEKLKTMIQDKIGIPPDQQRLIYGGKVLQDFKTLSFYHICKDSTVDLIKRLR